MDINYPVVIIAAAVTSVAAEVIHPHIYGLDLLPSFRIEIGDNKYLHIHHWLYGLTGLTILYLWPTPKKWLNSMLLGGLLGMFAQGLSYSTSHFVLYDRERFELARANDSE